MPLQSRRRPALSTSRAFALASLLCALAFLGAAQLSQAATWYVNPRIENATGSGTENCAGHQGWTGCVLEEEAWVEGGEFVANPYGPVSGRHELPTNTEPVDQPSFGAPYFDEGAEGHFAYRMPDGNLYGLLAIDDTNGLGLYPTAMPLCSSQPGKIQTYACMATEEVADKTEPSSKNFNPEFTFTPLGAAPFTAAGQRCVVPGYSTVDCTGGNGWSPLDTGAYMFLQFEELSSSTEVVVSDSTRPGNNECRLGGTGSKCEVTTYPGSSGTLEVANHGEASAEVVVLAEGEEPKNLATEEKAALIGIIAEALAEALKAWDEGEGDFAVGATPRLSGLQVTTGAPAESTSAAMSSPAAAATSGGSVTVRYHDDHQATSVFTLSRALRGVRHGSRCVPAPSSGRTTGPACTTWSHLRGLHVRAASDSYSALRGRHGKGCPRAAEPTAQGGCHLKLKLYGHLRHQDHPGPNQISFRAVDGKPLAPAATASRPSPYCTPAIAGRSRRPSPSAADRSLVSLARVSPLSDPCPVRPRATGACRSLGPFGGPPSS
jgi:hypothetical protein